MPAQAEIRPLPPGASLTETVQRLNQEIYLRRGDSPGYVNLVGYDGTKTNQDATVASSGNAALHIKPAAAVAAILCETSAGTQILLVNDSGVVIAALTVTGDITAGGNLKWKSGTAFTVELDHAATANRVITVPDATDTLALLARTQTFSGQNTFSNGTAPIIAAKVGPSSTQQHTLPVVTSDTIALLDASQILTHKRVLLQDGTLANPGFGWDSDPDSGGRWVASGRYWLTANAADIMQIANTGTVLGVGIGAAPSVPFHVATTQSADFIAIIEQTTNTAGRKGLQVKSASTTAADTALDVMVAGTSALRVFGDNSTTIAGPLTVTNGQIVFPATQVPSAGANTLDDYEEGTWTPIIGGTATYSLQDGRYTKVGRVLYVSARLIINAVGTGSVSTISGLPFSVAANGVMGVAVHYWSGSATNYVHIAGLFTGATIQLQSATAALGALTASTFFASGADICLSGFYVI